MICKTMDGWLSASPSHVAVVNCLAGKGRTGVIISCYMLFSGFLLERHMRAAHVGGRHFGAHARELPDNGVPERAAARAGSAITIDG
jgi:hypothetical protein